MRRGTPASHEGPSMDSFVRRRTPEEETDQASARTHVLFRPQAPRLTGPVEILTDPDLKKILWDESWRVYFPMEDADPDYVVLRIKPTEAEGWWGLKKFRLTPEELR